MNKYWLQFKWHSLPRSLTMALYLFLVWMVTSNTGTKQGLIAGIALYLVYLTIETKFVDVDVRTYIIENE